MADPPPPADAPPADPPSTPPGPAPDAVPPAEPPADPPAGDNDLAALHRENTSFRRRLRETETGRDQLAQRLERMQRGEVERQAAGHGMSTPSDLWLLVQDLGELLVDGELNPDRVGERVQGILRERPSWRRTRPDYGSGARGVTSNGKPLGLSDLLKEQERKR